MNEIDYAYLVWLGLAVWGAYYLGRREGISMTLDYMKEKNILILTTNLKNSS